MLVLPNILPFKNVTLCFIKKEMYFIDIIIITVFGELILVIPIYSLNLFVKWSTINFSRSEPKLKRRRMRSLHYRLGKSLIMKFVLLYFITFSLLHTTTTTIHVSTRRWMGFKIRIKEKQKTKVNKKQWGWLKKKAMRRNW